MTHDSNPEGRSKAREWAVTMAWLTLAIVMTWPLGRLWNPVLPTLNDAQFNVWRLAWVAHQLPVDPWHLFDANIFHPTTGTLAYSDAMLLLGVAGAPLIWAGIHPVVVHNLLVIGGFWLASYGSYRLCLHLTNQLWPAVVGGIIGGFAPYRFGHIAHLELLWTAFLPLSLLALMQLVEQPSRGAALRLATYQVLQTLCSIYYGIYLAIYLGVATVVLVMGRSRAVVRGSVTHLAGAALIAAVILLPYIAVYGKASQTIARRPVEEITQFSAVPGDYLRLSADNKLPWLTANRDDEERSLYPGAAAAMLSLVALGGGTRAALTFGVLGMAAVDLSFGMNGWLYPQLLRLLPFLAVLRAPARYGALVVVGLSALGALGAARVRAWSRAPRWLGPAMAAIMLMEYRAAPLDTREYPRRPPPVYAWLAQQPRGVVLELPLPTPDTLWGSEAEYQFMSIYHWQPLANGYSGNPPPSYIGLLTAMEAFPSAGSIDKLREHHVRWVLIHDSLVGPAAFTQLMQRVLDAQAFRTIGTFGDGRGQATMLEVLPPSL